MFTLVMDSNGEPEKFKASPSYPAVTPTCGHRTWDQTQASYPFHTPCPCPDELRLEPQPSAEHSGLSSLLKPGRQRFTGKDSLSRALAGHRGLSSDSGGNDKHPITSQMECQLPLSALSTEVLGHRRTFRGLLWLHLDSRSPPPIQSSFLF